MGTWDEGRFEDHAAEPFKLRAALVACALASLLACSSTSPGCDGSTCEPTTDGGDLPTDGGACDSGACEPSRPPFVFDSCAEAPEDAGALTVRFHSPDSGMSATRSVAVSRASIDGERVDLRAGSCGCGHCSYVQILGFYPLRSATLDGGAVLRTYRALNSCEFYGQGDVPRGDAWITFWECITGSGAPPDPYRRHTTTPCPQGMGPVVWVAPPESGVVEVIDRDGGFSVSTTGIPFSPPALPGAAAVTSRGCPAPPAPDFFLDATLDLTR